MLKDLSNHSFAFDCANNIRYFGMSGSSVWNLNIHLCRAAEEWTPQMITFAGLVTRWDRENGFIISTRDEPVKSFLKEGIEWLRRQWKNEDAGDE